MRGSDSGLGRAAFAMADRSHLPGGSNAEAGLAPSHLYNLLKAHADGKGDAAVGVFDALRTEVPDTYLVRRLYELCEEREIVWEGGQHNPNADDGAQEGPTGRFPHVDEQASLVDELTLKEILRLRHKTNSRRHPIWTEKTYQCRVWHKQYLRRRHMLKDEVKARVGILKQGLSEG